jgi:death on curing protein
VKEPVWVTREAVLAIQARLLAQFGGLPGLRDEGLLDSALSRPMHLRNYGDPDIFDMAASYALGIVKNHPFLDGNKRAGFMTAYTFLGANRAEFSAPEEEVVLQTLALAAGELTESDYAAWLRASCPATKRKAPRKRK